MFLRHIALVAASLACLASVAAAQSAPPPSGAGPQASAQATGAAAPREGLDFDTLAACSVVYRQIGQIYLGRSDGEKHGQFEATATAYAATALHVLGYTTPDQEAAYNYAEERMLTVVDALNKESSANKEGDMGVISKWLPYCDTLGNDINRLLAARTQRGW